MVTFKENRFVIAASSDQKVDGLAGFGPAIDIVSEKDVNCAHRSRVGEISVDHSEHFLKQIGAAMNIADGVDPNSVRQSGPSNFAV